MAISEEPTCQAAKLLTLTLLIVGNACLAQQPNRHAKKSSALENTVERVSRSIIHVSQTFHMSTNEDLGHVGSWTRTGTGFVANENGLIVTAAHVVGAEDARMYAEADLKRHGKTPKSGSFSSEIEISLYHTNSDERPNGNLIYDVQEFFPARILAIDSNRDTAVLECIQNLVKSPAATIKIGNSGSLSLSVPTLQKSPPRPGALISTTGFPAVDGEDTGLPGLTTSTGIISNAFYMDAKNRHFYLADMHVNPGDSGAPVFNNQDGRIIGMTDAYFTTQNRENSHLALIIPARDFLALLAGLPNQPVQASPH